jgi:glycosyltransferase involved in cell wall biosynthesis
MTGGSQASLRVAVLSRAVFPFHGVGGLERHVYDLVRHLLAHGVTVTLITKPPSSSARPPGVADTFDHPGLRLRTVPYLTFPFAGRRGTTVVDRSTAYLVFGHRAGRLAAALARSGQIDLVHGLGASCLGYAGPRRQSPDGTVPLIFNPQGLEEFGANDPTYGGMRAKRIAYAPLRAAVRKCAAAADRVIATDRVLEPVVRKHLPVDGGRIRVVPNAIDLECCDRIADVEAVRHLDRTLRLEASTPILLSVGRLEQNKGFHLLADALGRLTDLPWRWLLIGDGPFRNAIRQRVDQRGLANRTILMGRVDDPTLHAAYEAATIFVHPTLYEGSSLVTLEAMAHRRPVVASRAGGLPDKVAPGSTGWLVEPGSADQLAAALREALSDPARLRRMGVAGRLVVEREFSWPAAVRTLIGIYEEAIGRHILFP